MTQTLARIKKGGKQFEIMVNLENALAFKKGDIVGIEAEGDKVFKDSKKGMVASSSDLEEAFGTFDVRTVAEKIVKEGEIQTTQEHRDAEQEKRIKQVIDFLATNAIDPKTGNPHSFERIKNAIEQAHVNVKNTPIESQMKEIIMQVSKVIPIKLETKRVKVIVPAIHTGQVYGITNPYKEEEKWYDDGSLEVVVKIPAGLVMGFYDKLNAITHGSATTEELKEATE